MVVRMAGNIMVTVNLSWHGTTCLPQTLSKHTDLTTECGTGAPNAARMANGYAHTPEKHQDNFVKKRKAVAVTPDNQGQAPPTAVAQMATPQNTASLAAPLSSTDIAKLVAEQVATQFQAHFAAFRTQSSRVPNEADMDAHILQTDW